MSHIFIEPTQIEIRLTLGLGLTILSPVLPQFRQKPGPEW